MLLNVNEVKRWAINAWIRNQPKILLLLVLAALFYFLKQLPYFNLILTLSLIFVFFWLISLFLFRLKSDLSVVVATLTLAVTAFVFTIQMKGAAQELASAAYYLHIVAFSQVLLEARNEKRKII